jgi:hypothetical protein
MKWRRGTPMSGSNTIFGRRGPDRPAHPPKRGIPILFKQIGGIAVGAAIVFALAGGHSYFMKQAGKALDQKFVAGAAAGNPQGAIGPVAARDTVLQGIHQTCTRRAALAEVTSEQLDATPTHSVAGGEIQLTHSGAYVACLAQEQPKRFCDKSQRQYLAQAVREYLKLLRQTREEWQIQTNGPAGHALDLTNAPASAGQPARVELPSDRLDPQLVKGLRALVAEGLITAGDFGGFAGIGVPGEVAAALKDVQARKRACA